MKRKTTKRIGGSQMAKTIFRVLKNHNQNIVVSNMAVYRKLVELLERGGITNSEVEQFISKNYMLSVEDLTKKWNMTHTKQKIEMTFRGQISTLSSKYYKLFGVNASNFEEALLSGDNNHPIIIRILKILTAIEVDSEPLVSRFRYGIIDYLGDYETDNTYEVSECENELRLLKMLDKKNLELIFSKFDKDKLAYIVQMMNADLIQSEVTDFERLDKHTRQVIKKNDGSVALRRVISPVVNDMKMELCLRFNNTKPMKLSVAKKINDMQVVNENAVEVAPDNMMVSKSIEQNVNNPYGLHITTELVQLIEKRLKVKRMVAELNDMDSSKIITYKKYLQSLTMETSREELYQWLRTVNAVYLGMALDELKYSFHHNKKK